MGEQLLIDQYKELLYVYTGQYSLIVVSRFNDPNQHHLQLNSCDTM